jgi:hypothetical protein
MSTSSFHFSGPVRHENLEIHFLIEPSVLPEYHKEDLATLSLA